jgi:hypothetical protein
MDEHGAYLDRIFTGDKVPSQDDIRTAAQGSGRARSAQAEIRDAMDRNSRELENKGSRNDWVDPQKIFLRPICWRQIFLKMLFTFIQKMEQI